MKKDIKGSSNQSSMAVHAVFSAEAGLGSPIITSGYASNGKRYIPYSSSSKRYNTQNTYPQWIASLVVDSPTHGAAIALKSMLTFGQGFDQSALTRPTKKALSNMNDKNQTIDDILEKVAQDWVTFNGLAIKVIWNKSGKIASVERLHFSEVRAGEPDADGNINYYLVSNNWDNQMPHRLKKEYSLPVFNPKIFQRLRENKGLVNDADLTEEEIANGAQIIYYYKELNSPATNGMSYYPVPDYAGGIDSIMSEIDIVVSNKSLINNGVGGKTFVYFMQQPADDKAAAEVRQTLIKNLAGASNNGGIVVGYADGKDYVPQITSLPALEADTYKGLFEQCVQSIVTAHRIPSILLNISNTGGFSNAADEMEAAFNMMNRTVIAGYCRTLEKVFNSIVSYMGYDVDLQIVPFSLLTEQNNTSKEVAGTETSLDSK